MSDFGKDLMESARRADTRREVLSDVDPVVLEAWRLQGRKVGAMLAEAQSAVIELQEALRDIADDYADRFDLNSPSTNPGIKSLVQQARAVLRGNAGVAVGPAPRALDEFKACGGDEEPDPLERLRFFCSLAFTNGQDWLDVEPFFDAVIARSTHPRGVPEAPAGDLLEQARKVYAYLGPAFDGEPARVIEALVGEVLRLRAPGVDVPQAPSENKNCHNCKYSAVPDDSAPCRHCAYFEKWTHADGVVVEGGSDAPTA